MRHWDDSFIPSFRSVNIVVQRPYMSEWCGCMLITRFLDRRTRQAAWSGWHTAREGVEAELSWVGPPKESNKEQGQGGLLWAAWTWPRYCMAHMSND